MSIQLIAIDIDGTMLNTERQITSEVKKTIKEAIQQGIKIVLCTGRASPGISEYIEELGLNNKEDYSITYNGSLLKRTDTGEIITHHTLDHSHFVHLYNIAQKAGVHFHGIHDEGIFTPNKDISEFTVHESFVTHVPLFHRTIVELDEQTRYSKMMMIDRPEVLEKGIERLPKTLWDEYTILRSEPYFLEFLNKNASKGTAVKELAERLQIPKNNVMAIGDSQNDLDMIENVGLGVAMGNATQEIKDAAVDITDTSDNNGVAKAIKKYALA